MYVLYCHKNKINGKEYIGITSDYNKRFSSNGKHYKDSPKFWLAIEKYGWNNFDHIILERELTLEEARLKEIETIKERNSIKNGYNISEGGDVPPARSGKDNHNYGGLSAEVKIKMKNNHADFKLGKHPRARKVMCVETQETFNTITEAAIKYNISRKCVNDTCTGRQKTAAGYHWKYI